MSTSCPVRRFGAPFWHHLSCHLFCPCRFFFQRPFMHYPQLDLVQVHFPLAIILSLSLFSITHSSCVRSRVSLAPADQGPTIEGRLFPFINILSSQSASSSVSSSLFLATVRARAKKSVPGTLALRGKIFYKMPRPLSHPLVHPRFSVHWPQDSPLDFTSRYPQMLPLSSS